jgi:hypothetical protein
MKYHGKELKPITEPQVFDPPKLMLVWDEDDEPIQRNVIAILPESAFKRRVMTLSGVCWEHCAEYEEIQPRRATNLEFSRWLSKGCGQIHTDSDGGFIDTAILYDDKCDDSPVRDGLMARKWGDKEWHEPTIDYLGIKEG